MCIAIGRRRAGGGRGPTFIVDAASILARAVFLMGTYHAVD